MNARGNTTRRVASTHYAVLDGGTPPPILTWDLTWTGEGYPHPDLGWRVLPVSRMGVPPPCPGRRVPLCQQDGGTSPPPGVNRLKILPSIILQMRAVKTIGRMSQFLIQRLPVLIKRKESFDIVKRPEECCTQNQGFNQEKRKQFVCTFCYVEKLFSINLKLPWLVQISGI